MSRPIKSGLDYFPHDTNLSEDQGIEILESDHGLIGYAIYMKLLEKIYNNSYYLEFPEKSKKIFCYKNNIDQSQFNEIFNTLIEEKLFNKELFDNHEILTSRGIQKRFFFTTKKRGKIKINSRYLIDSPEIDIKSELIEVNSPEIKINESESTQRKEKESKEKESKDTPEFQQAEILTDLFYSTLSEDLKKRYEKYREKWIDSFEMSIRLDGYDIEQIKQIINKFRNDDFWSSNFLSPMKLRKKNKDEIKYIDVFWNKIKSNNNEKWDTVGPKFSTDTPPDHKPDPISVLKHKIDKSKRFVEMNEYKLNNGEYKGQEEVWKKGINRVKKEIKEHEKELKELEKENGSK